MQQQTPDLFGFKMMLATTTDTYNSTKGRREHTTEHRDEGATDECLGIREKGIIHL